MLVPASADVKLGFPWCRAFPFPEVTSQPYATRHTLSKLEAVKVGLEEEHI
jgi:hypothetical protein